MNKALKAQKRPLLIVIDDIDRLPADEIRQILRMVKSVADLPYITYLLGFDKDIVKRALKIDIDPQDNERDPNKSSWIEKIVQGSFDLPIILQSRLEFYFSDKLKDQLNDIYKLLFEDIELFLYLESFLKTFIYEYLKTPRQVNRLLNALTLQWMATSKFINPFDLVFIETCRLFKPELYNLIKNHKEDFCENPQDFCYKLKNMLSEKDIESFKLCFFIEAPYQLMNSNRIYSKKYFINYFLYDQNPAYLSVKEAQHIDNLLTQNNTEEIIKIIDQNISETLEGGYPKNLALLDEWQGNIKHFKNNKLKNILTVIATTHNRISSINSSATSQSNVLFLDICEIISKEKEFDTFIVELYRQHPLSGLMVHYILNCAYVVLNGARQDNIVSNFLNNNFTTLKSIKKSIKKKSQL